MSNQQKQPFGGILKGLFAPGKNIPTNTSAVINRTNTRVAVGNVSTSVSDASKISILAIISYIAVVCIIVLIFLIFIDRFITPVFKLRPGTPGIIPLPYGDDGILYWTKTPQLIRDDSTIISNLASGYTLSLDIYIQNPMAFSKTPRKLFWRGTNILFADNSPAQPNNFGIKEYNLLFSLAKDTNDLTVSTQLEKTSTNDNPTESITINNVPIRKGFRVTVVMFNKLMEVYLNGKLYQSRPLTSQPLPSFHFFNPPTPDGESAGTVRNLKIWNRCLSSSEVREIIPPISDFSDFTNYESSCTNVSEIANALINKI